MSKAKVVSSTLANHFKLSSRHNPSIDKEKEDMRRVLYALAVGSLTYAMVCTRPDIAYAVGVVSHFLSNLGRLHDYEIYARHFQVETHFWKWETGTCWPH